MSETMALEKEGETVQRPSNKPDLGRKQKWFRAYEHNKRDEQDEARESRRYYHGKQWTSEELEKLRRRGQPAITDNRIGRKIDFLIGVEQRMRRDPKAYPRTPNHDQEADIATACVRYVCDVSRWEAIASAATHDGMVSAIGIVWVGVEQAGNEPDVRIKQINCTRFFYDPRSVRCDFTDARFMGLHLWLDIDEAIEKWPDQEERLEKLLDAAKDISTRTVELDEGDQWADFETRRVRVVEFWERRRDGWYFCNFCGDIELESGVSPYLDENKKPDCPYVAWSPYIDEKGDRYGPSRNMKSMQDEINHRRSKFLHMINVRQVYSRKGDIDDMDELRKQLQRPDGVIEHNGEWGSTTGVIDMSQELKGQAELLAQAQAALENLGPNPGLIGKGGGVADQSGRAILAQRDSGMTELSPVFERLRDWKLRVYRKVWARIQQAWTAERFIRVTDDEDAIQFVGINQYEVDPMTGQLQSQGVVAEIDVDIILEEGPDTITMNEELLQALSQLAGAPPQLWGVVIELMNVPNKDKLLQMVQQATMPAPAAPDPLQQAAMEQELRGNEAKIAETQSKVDLNRANAFQKMTDAHMRQMEPVLIEQYGPQPQQGASLQ